MDYIGPYMIKIGDKKHKVWLLAFTCLWSRSVNLKICFDLTVKNFLRAFQMHIFEFGLPSRITSDLGTQLVAGANIISSHLDSVESRAYLAESGILSVKFEQYYKGNSALGSLIEICVKLTKRLIYGAIRKSVLSLSDFEFIIAQTRCLINKRPISFKEALRDEDSDVPAPITPELLIHGHDLATPNVIPTLEGELSDESWLPTGNSCGLDKDFSKLRKIRANLIESYNVEFLGNLLSQATNITGRYKPVPHSKLEIGDIILLKEVHFKSSDFPLARVISIVTNDIGEVTDVTAKKGKTREIVKRHVTSVIPLMRPECVNTHVAPNVTDLRSETNRAPRIAKLRSIAKTKAMLQN